MSDANPPQPFNWNLPPKKPEDTEEPASSPAPPAPPAHPTAYPPIPPAYPPAPPTNAPAPPAYPPAAPAYPPAPPQAAAPPPPYQPYTPPPPTQAGPAFPTGSYGYPPTDRVPPPLVPPVQPPPYEEVPTQAFAYDPFATQAFPFDGALSGATEVLGAQPVGLPELRDEGAKPRQPASAIDALFGESQFQEYEPGALPSEGIGALVSSRPREPREPMGRPQKVLLAVAGGLLAALALLGLFTLGTKLSGLFPAQQPVAAPSVKPTAVADARPPAVGPVAVGTYAWNELLGTECLDQFMSAWQETFNVVDCAALHNAQLVYHGYFSDESYAPYPGVDALQKRINLLCTSPSSVDYSVASGFADIQISASYAATPEQWDAGERDYYCFVTRSSTEPFTASVAVPVVPSTELVATVPGNEP